MNFYLREKGADLENQLSALPSFHHRVLRRGAFLGLQFTSSCQAFILYVELKEKIKLYIKPQRLSKDPIHVMPVEMSQFFPLKEENNCGILNELLFVDYFLSGNNICQ